MFKLYVNEGIYMRIGAPGVLTSKQRLSLNRINIHFWIYYVN